MAHSLQISCKLTHALILFFENEGQPLGALFEGIEEPEEFLRNPSCWISASLSEKFIERASRISGIPVLADAVGRKTPELGAWGALDSVLRLMGKPGEYYGNIGKFLGYFVSPMGKFQEVEKREGSIKFVFPFSRSEFPNTFDFLRAVLESLPLYTGQLSTKTEYDSKTSTMHVSWQTGQATLFDDDPGQMLSPKLVQQLVSNLESHERLLEERNRELMVKNQEIEELKSKLVRQGREKAYAEKMTGLAQLAAGVAHEINNPISFVVSNIKRFKEYFISVQTYINALELEAGRLEQKRKALDIDFLNKEVPMMLEESLDGLSRVTEIVRDLSSLAHPRAGAE